MSPAVTALKKASAECKRCEAGRRHANEMEHLYRLAADRANREGIYLIAWDAMRREERWLRIAYLWEKKLAKADTLYRKAHSDAFSAVWL